MSKKKNIDKMRTPSVGKQVFNFSGLAPAKPLKPDELAEKLGILESELKDYFASLVNEIAGGGFAEGDWVSWDELYELLDNFYVGITRIFRRTIINIIEDTGGGGGGFDNITGGDGIVITGDNRDIEIAVDKATDSGLTFSAAKLLVDAGDGLEIA